MENSECTFVSLIGQAVQFVLVGAPGPVREGGGGRAGGILSPFAWVGSSSSQGGRREEEMKPLSYVACLRIKEGGGIKVGSKCERKTPASVCGSRGCGWSARSGQAPYHLPNLRLTLMKLQLCNSNRQRQFFLTLEARTHVDAAHVLLQCPPLPPPKKKLNNYT